MVPLNKMIFSILNDTESEQWFSSCSHRFPEMKYGFSVIQVNKKTTHVLVAKSPEEKSQWVKSFQEALNGEDASTEVEEPKVLKQRWSPLNKGSNGFQRQLRG
jgi:hypothetical protein